MILRKNQLNNLKLFFKQIPKKYLFLYIFSGLIFFLSFFIDFKIPLSQKRFIDTAIESKIIFNSFFIKIVILYLLNFILSNCAYFISYKLNLNLIRYFTAQFFKKILLLKKKEIIKSGTGYYYNILSADIDSACSLLSLTSFQFLFSFIRTIFVLIIIYHWSFAIFLNIVIALLLTSILSVLYANINKNIYKKMRKDASELAGNTVDYFSNNFIVKIFLTVDRFTKSFKQKYNISYKNMNKLLFSNTSSQLFISIINSTSFFIMLVLSIKLIIEGQITYGTLIALISYFTMTFAPVQDFNNLINLFARIEISVYRLNKIENKVSEYSNCSSNKMLLFSKIKSLCLENVDFGYNGDIDYHNINVKITSGKRVGFVGLSGKGKTSILKIIYLENLPKKGMLTINGINVLNLPPQYYFSHLNIYSQDMEIFNKDLIFNLTLGKQIIPLIDKDKVYNKHILYFQKVLDKIRQIYKQNIKIDKKIRKINKLLSAENRNTDFFKIIGLYLTNIKTANLEQHLNFINSILSNSNSVTHFSNIEFYRNYVIKERLDLVIEKLKLDILKNREFGENGSFISGGEKHKIAFARFLLKGNYSFFILDEPFTNIDAITEKELLNVAQDFLKDKTGLIISHKFNILKKLATDLMVIDEGKIVERGTHRELVNKNGLYKKIYDHFQSQRDN